MEYKAIIEELMEKNLKNEVKKPRIRPKSLSELADSRKKSIKRLLRIKLKGNEGLDGTPTEPKRDSPK